MGDGSVRPQGPSSFGEGGAQTESAGGGAAGRGLLGAIIVVCLIGLLFGGGLVLVPKFFLSPGALLNPGVIAWEGQGNAQASTLAHSGQAQTAQSGPDVKTSCRKTGSSSLQEHLIGGGFDFQPGSDPSVAAPDNSASQWDWRLHLTSGKATSYAICLREPPAFFSPANALDYVAGPVAAPSFDDPFTAIASEASCSSGGSSSLLPINSSSTIAPSAGHIVGGGYVLGGSTPPRVNSSYPIVDGSGARWHVSADAFGLPSSSNLQAFAICSGTVTTHLEHTALKMFVGDPLTFFGDGAASCTSGTLLSGGYHVTDGQDDIGLGVDIQTNAPGKSLKVNATTGDTFTDWTVTLNGTSKGAKAKSVIGDVWVVCWDPTAQPQPTQTTQTTQATPTTQAVPTATPVGVAQPTPTPTPRPQPTPTNTPAPQCQVFMQGSASNVNVDLSDINLDGSGPATQPNASSHIRYSQLPASGAIFSPVNSSTLHDVAIGADYGALDCARLRGFSYGGGTAPYTVGEVFAVKTPGGHYAKVLIAAGVGGPLQVQWVTYTIS